MKKLFFFFFVILDYGILRYVILAYFLKDTGIFVFLFWDKGYFNYFGDMTF